MKLYAEGALEPDRHQPRQRNRRPNVELAGHVLNGATDELSLVAMVDDATSELFAFFYSREAEAPLLVGNAGAPAIQLPVGTGRRGKIRTNRAS